MVLNLAVQWHDLLLGVGAWRPQPRGGQGRQRSLSQAHSLCLPGHAAGRHLWLIFRGHFHARLLGARPAPQRGEGTRFSCTVLASGAHGHTQTSPELWRSSPRPVFGCARPLMSNSGQGQHPRVPASRLRETSLAGARTRGCLSLTTHASPCRHRVAGAERCVATADGWCAAVVGATTQQRHATPASCTQPRLRREPAPGGAPAAQHGTAYPRALACSSSDSARKGRAGLH